MAADAKWPFADPTNLGVFTTVGVMNRTEPICLVTHDLDGSWQFLPRSGASMPRDARIIALKEAVDADQSLLELANLPRGWQATRQYQYAVWQRSRSSKRSRSSN